ncbi:hypothetical protein Nepgr_002220 [Nepenthes gracilis]|uniref:Uncharacterized protein n=1 Tax=Nepenthes gracilis TaxID=150966 RepID=A0AAD3RY54_NEPGR|nr:hypothetical protein Nepgr_002220 [Nepenthes gracilis]
MFGRPPWRSPVQSIRQSQIPRFCYSKNGRRSSPWPRVCKSRSRFPAHSVEAADVIGGRGSVAEKIRLVGRVLVSKDAVPLVDASPASSMPKGEFSPLIFVDGKPIVSKPMAIVSCAREIVP